MVNLLQVAGFVLPDGRITRVGSVHLAFVDERRVFLGYEKNKQLYDFFGGDNDDDSLDGDETSSVLNTTCNESLEELCVVFNEPLEAIVIGCLRCRVSSLLIVCHVKEIPVSLLTSVMQRRQYAPLEALSFAYREMSACGWVSAADIRAGIPVTEYVREQFDAVVHMYDEEMKKGLQARGNLFDVQFTIESALTY